MNQSGACEGFHTALATRRFLVCDNLSCSASEIDAQDEVDDARRSSLPADPAEARAVKDRAAKCEVGVIESVVEGRLELHLRALVHLRPLAHAEIGLPEGRAVD